MNDDHDSAKTTPVRAFLEREWRLAVFNVENLFLYFDQPPLTDVHQFSKEQWKKLSSSTIDNKPLNQVLDLARAIDDINPDFLMLCEVGGRESLANFSRYFLNDRYSPYLVEGNSDRGIDIGFLVKRGLPFKYDLVSHKNRKIDFLYPHEKDSKQTGYKHPKSHRFSRDVVELRVYQDDHLELVLMLVHLKSPLDRDRIDPGGRDRRRAEFETLMKIYNEVRVEYPGTAVAVAGDFNGLASGPERDSEFASLDSSDLRCALDVAGVPVDERYTWAYFSGQRPGYYRQIDYIFVSPELARRVDSHLTWVYRFKDEFGMTRVAPRNANEKRLLPSDHFPVVVTLLPDDFSSALKTTIDPQDSNPSRS